MSDLDQTRIGVFCSGMALAEITPTAIITSGQAMKDFYDTFMAHFAVIHTNIEIMKSVAQVKGRSYIHKDPQKNQKCRNISTADAVHLMTALYAQKHLTPNRLIFHTFDNGRSRTGGEPKTVPLLSLRDWTENCADDPLIARLRELRIEAPCHPALPRPGET